MKLSNTLRWITLGLSLSLLGCDIFKNEDKDHISSFQGQYQIVSTLDYDTTTNVEQKYFLNFKNDILTIWEGNYTENGESHLKIMGQGTFYQSYGEITSPIGLTQCYEPTFRSLRKFDQNFCVHVRELDDGTILHSLNALLWESSDINTQGILGNYNGIVGSEPGTKLTITEGAFTLTSEVYEDEEGIYSPDTQPEHLQEYAQYYPMRVPIFSYLNEATLHKLGSKVYEMFQLDQLLIMVNIGDGAWGEIQANDEVLEETDPS